MVQERLAKLRHEMSKRNISIYIVPTADYHESEYVGEYFKARQFISGFTGSAGVAVITPFEAKLWTDGRYFIQASKQLKETPFTLMKTGEEGVPTVDEYIEKINSGTPYILRFKSLGDHNNKVAVHDEIRGDLELTENDQDIVILKSDGLPTYHFAHIVDDFLMGTTHVVRGEEWLSSAPKHVELFNAFGFKVPNYVHTPLIIKKEGNSIRKISKRKDPEASMSYYTDLGYPAVAVIESLMTIINSNYEEWHRENPDKNFTDFREVLSFDTKERLAEWSVSLLCI